MPTVPSRRRTLVRWKPAPLILVACAIIAVAHGQRLSLLMTRGFDLDEFQHLHGAWRMSQGDLIYSDFFEHHTPLLQLFLAPMFRFFSVDIDADSAVAFLFFARRIMWVLACAILLTTFLVGRSFRDWRVGLVAAAWLSLTLMYFQKTLEIRPDLISVPCWLGCLTLLLMAIRAEDPSSRKTRILFAGSGFLLGCGIMATQKMLFAMPAFALAMLWHLFDPRSGGRFLDRFWNAAAQFGGWCAPLGIVVAYFWLHDAADELIYYNLILNLKWKVHFSPKGYLTDLVQQNPFLVAFAIAGTFRAFVGMFRCDAFQRGDYILVLNLIGLVVGLFLMPVPYRQYYLMFLPLMSIMAGSLMVETADQIAERRPTPELWVALVIMTIALVWTVIFPETAVVPSPKYVAVWVVALGIAIVQLHRRMPEAAIAVVLLPLCIFPFQQIEAESKWKNDRQIERVRYILENTSARETVMGGWSGYGVFRPHAWYYWMLHSELRAMLTAEEKADILRRLKSGEVAPTLIVFDRSLRGVSEELTHWLEEHYAPTELDPIRRRIEPSGS